MAEEFVCDGALMKCNMALLPLPNALKVIRPGGATINGKKKATACDCIPLVNIPSFGACKATSPPVPCVPVPSGWKQTARVRSNGSDNLLKGSSMHCGKGGEIEFLLSGQMPVGGLVTGK